MPIKALLCGLLITLASLPALANLNLSPTTNTLLSGQAAPSFLPVEEAYQVSVQRHAAEVEIRWQIAPEYFLYGHNLQISIDDTPLTTLPLPPARQHRDETTGEDLPVYFDQLSLTIPLPAAASSLQVNYQGCALAGLCYPPQIQRFDITAPTATALTITRQPPAVAAPTATTPPTSPATGPALAGAIVLALVGGLILNLMPCVFPVLSLKALSLTSGSNSLRQRRLQGWSYTAGSVLTFVGVATALYLARNAGQAVGWGFQLQSPIVISGLIYLFFLMGLSLTGILQLRMPWTNLGNDLTQGHSLKASFFTGALASIVASPCTAPFMGAALGFAMTQPATTGLLVFAALGLGMAIPFLLLCHIPQLSRWLPRPGAWMEILKQGLGFPLFITAIWLLWVLGHQTSADAVVGLVGGLTLLAFAAWLLHPNMGSRLSVSRHILASVAALAALTLIPLNRDQAPKTSSWEVFSNSRLHELRQRGEPVFVNLTADWCITCKANEKFALDTATTINAFREAGVYRLKGDWTNADPSITALLVEHGRSGVPLYLFYSGSPDSPAHILPQLLTETLLAETIGGAIAHKQAQ